MRTGQARTERRGTRRRGLPSGRGRRGGGYRQTSPSRVLHLRVLALRGWIPLDALAELATAAPGKSVVVLGLTGLAHAVLPSATVLVHDWKFHVARFALALAVLGLILSLIALVNLDGTLALAR